MPFLDPVNYRFDTSLSLEAFSINQFTICSNGHDLCASMFVNCLIDQNYLAATFEENKIVILVPVSCTEVNLHIERIEYLLQIGRHK